MKDKDIEKELERVKARLTALERILRVDAIQAQGDAVDAWWHSVHDANDPMPSQIEAAGMQAAKEVLATKNRRRRARPPLAGEGQKVPKVK